MLNYLLRRIIFLIITLWGITVVTFLVMKLVPDDPVKKYSKEGMKLVSSGEMLLDESYEELRRYYNFDKPVVTQYLIWLENILSFDFGYSHNYKKPVSELIIERAFVTVQINFAAILLIYFISIPLGIYLSLKLNSLFDRVTTVFLYILYSLPIFFIAYLLIFLFSDVIGIFPSSGLYNPEITLNENGFLPWFIDRMKHRALPVLCMSFGGYAYLTMLMRGSMLDVLRQDYITASRMRGYSQKRIVFKHALRNAIIPIITHFSTVFPLLISGSVVLEVIFQINGMGKLVFDAIFSKDYNVVMTVTLFSAFLTLAGILLTDILYVVFNPGISFEKENI